MTQKSEDALQGAPYGAEQKTVGLPRYSDEALIARYRDLDRIQYASRTTAHYFEQIASEVERRGLSVPVED